MRFEALRDEYAALWQHMHILPERLDAVRQTAVHILANATRYREVEGKTGVPWYVVGIIHKMECSRWPSFSQHLHNGDPLTARTVNVPKGRPANKLPPFDWTDSAVDALRYDGLDKVRHWTIERIAFELERYNGFGYRMRSKPRIWSPYLWSFTNHYSRGKFTSDGVYDADAVSQQSGAMAILRALMEASDEVCPRPEADAVAETHTNENEVPVRVRETAPTPTRDLVPSSRKMRLLERVKLFSGVGGGAAGLTSMSDTFDVSRGIADAIRTVLADHVLLVVFLAAVGMAGVALVLQHWIGQDHAEGRYQPRDTA